MNVNPLLGFSACTFRGGLSTASRVVASISGLVFLSASVHATIYTYTAPNSTTTNTWSSGTAWSAVPVSAADTTLVFAGSFATTANTATSQDNIAGAFQLNAMTLSASEATNFVTATYNITSTGGTLNFVANGGTAPVVNLNSNNGTFGNNVSYNVSINASIDGGLLTFQGNGSSAFNYSGVLSDGATAANVTKTGSSALSLSGANTFSGGLTLSQGTLNINHASALGATAGTFTMASGVKIDNTTASAITNSQNNAQIWNGNFTWGGTRALNLGTGDVTLGANSIITAGGTGALTIGGAISDGVNSYSLTMGTPGSTNTGTLILANTANNYDGGTYVNSGFLQIAAAGSLGGSGANVTVNSGGAVNAAYALDQATLGRLTSGSTGVIGLAANSSNNLDLSAATGANLAVTLGGTGTYSGILTPQGTTYRLGGAGGTLVMSNALVDVSGSPTNLVVGAGGSSGTVTLNAAGTYSGGTTVVGAQGSTASKLQTNVLAGASTTPFGTNAAMALNNATLGLGTAATLASGNVMNVTGYDLTYTGQNTLQLAVGSGTSVTFAANSLTQGAAATDVLMFAPSSAVNFGTKEIVTVATGVPTVTNGMVAPNMVDSANRTFLTYGASGKTGFSDATSTSVASSAAWTALGTNAANTIVNFTGTGTIALGNVNAYALIINNNQANVTGTVTVGSGGVIFTGNGASSSSINLNFGSAHGYFGELGTGNFNHNGSIIGTGGVTFYGTSSINYGGSATSLTGGVVVAGNVSYDFNGNNAWNTVNSLTVTRSGGLSFNRGITQTFTSLTGEGVVSANPAGNNSSSTVTLALSGNGPDTTFSGVLSGSLLALSKAGSSTQVLSGNNTFVKGTTVSGGILKGTQTSDTPFGTGSVAIGAGILSLAPGGSGSNIVLTGANAASNSTFTFNAGAQVSLDKGGNTSLAYTVGNSAATANSVLVRGTSGTLIVAPASGLANLGTGSGEKFIVNGGVTTTNGIVSASIIGQNTDANKSGSFLGYDNTNGLVTGTYTDTNFASASSASVEDVTAATSVNTQTVYALRTSAALTLNAAQTLTVGNGSLPAGVILNGGSITGGTALAFGASPGVIYSSLANGSIGSVITGSGGVSFVGPGVTTLTGTNTYSGNTIINNSTVSVASVANNIGGNVTLNGGTLQSTATGSTTKTFSLNVGQTSTGGTLDVASGTTLTVSGVVSGTGSLTKANSGTLTVSGANTYTGATLVNAGTLKAGVASVAGTSGAFGKNSAVVMADVAGATLDITGFNTQIGSLTGGGATGGNVTLGAATLTTGADNTSPAAYAGVISGTGGLTKTGTGTQTLNAANTYSGTTTISAGTLALGSSGSIANSAIVNVGTSASQGNLDLTAKSSFAFGSGQTLSGYGTVNIGSGKMITINGTLAPGNSPGVLNVTGDLTLGSASTTNMEIISRNAGAPVAGTDFDRAAVTGALVFGGTLNINTTGLTGLIAGDSFQLFTANTYTAGFTSVVMSGAYAPSFSNNLGTWTGSDQGLNFTFTESTGILSVGAIPEPSTFALFGGMITLVIACGRRRRRA